MTAHADIPWHRFRPDDDTQLDQPILGEGQRAKDAGIGEVIEGIGQ